MAIFYASTSGSNTFPYDTWAKAATNIQTAINAMNADGDVVMAEDENWVISTPLTTNTFISAPPNNSTLLIRSRSDDVSLASLISDQSDKSVINFDQADRILDIKLSGFGLTKSVTHTSISSAAIASTSGQEGDIDLNGCNIRDVDVVYSLPTDGSGPIVRCAGPVRLVSFTDVDVDNVHVAANGGGTCSGLVSSGANPNLLFSGGSVKNSTFTQTGGGSTAIGWVYAKNALTVNNMTLDNLTSTKQVGTTGIHRPFFYAEDTFLDLTIDGITATNLDWINGGISGVVAMGSGPYDVKNMDVSFCTATEPTVNNLGCAFYAFGPSAVGVYADSVVHDCTAAHGTAFYAGQGGSGIVSRVIAYNNTSVGRTGIEAGGGTFYCGGWGDVTFNYCLAYDNIADEGGAVYAHVHTVLATRDKTTTLNNCVFVNNIATKLNGGFGGNGALFRAVNPTFSHTVNVINSIFSDGGVDEIFGTEIGGTLNLTVDHSDIIGGQAATTGVDVYTNNINADPKFRNPDADDFRILPGSPCIKSGTEVGLTSDLFGNKVGPAIGVDEYDGSGETSSII